MKKHRAIRIEKHDRAKNCKAYLFPSYSHPYRGLAMSSNEIIYRMVHPISDLHRVFFYKNAKISFESHCDS